MRDKIKAALLRLIQLAGMAVKTAYAGIDLRDVLCFGGLGCVGYGLALVYEPAAWCAVGAGLFWLSLRRPRGAA